MKTFFENMSSRLLALLAALVLAFAQSGAQAQPAYVFSQQELDQMLAPIALYPDPLLSQTLMASTYPLEVVEAARWSRSHPGFSGDDAVRAAESENWDPSVKSLVAFPQVLERMDENLKWTQALGDAFLDQESQVMDTVQELRRKAQAAGNLRSDDRVNVVESGPSLLLQPYDPQVVYVPYYDPTVVYGSWWWPGYPPVYWRPWPGYYAQPAYVGSFHWGSPIGISAGFFFGAFDWHRRHVRVVHVNNYYYRHSVVVNRVVIANRAPGAWRHEPQHRKGIAYRGIGAQRRFGTASAPQGQGNRVRQAEPRRSDVLDVRPATPPAIHPEARFDGRRPDARPAAETRANVQPAPTVQPAPADTRFDRRRDSRSDDRRDSRSDDRRDTGSDIRRDRRSNDRRDTRGDARSALPVLSVQSAPVVQPARVAPPSPAAQSTPTMRAAPAERRSDHRRDTRSTIQPAPPAPNVQHASGMQRAPGVHPAQAAPASSSDRPAARAEGRARREAR